MLGTVFLWVDYRMPLAPLRAELERVCRTATEWDQRVALLQVVETNERAMQLRALVSAADASKAWDLRCRVREALIDFMQREHTMLCREYVPSSTERGSMPVPMRPHRRRYAPAGAILLRSSSRRCTHRETPAVRRRAGPHFRQGE